MILTVGLFLGITLPGLYVSAAVTFPYCNTLFVSKGSDHIATNTHSLPQPEAVNFRIIIMYFGFIRNLRITLWCVCGPTSSFLCGAIGKGMEIEKAKTKQQNRLVHPATRFIVLSWFGQRSVLKSSQYIDPPDGGRLGVYNVFTDISQQARRGCVYFWRNFTVSQRFVHKIAVVRQSDSQTDRDSRQAWMSDLN